MKMNEIYDELYQIYKEMKPTCCEKCRLERCEELETHGINLQEKERSSIHGGYSNTYVGFSKDDKFQYLSPPIDVLLVLEGHGGKHDWPPREKQDFDSSIWEMKGKSGEDEGWGYYYHDCSKPFMTYHQKCVHTILHELDDEKISWFLTDLIKCYVFKDKKYENLKIAAKHCVNILIEQIEILEPRIICSFGNFVSSWVKECIEKGLIDKKYRNENRTIFRPFPSQQAADAWVKSGDVGGLIEKIKQKLWANREA